MNPDQRDRRPRVVWLFALATAAVAAIAVDVWLHVRSEPKAPAAAVTLPPTPLATPALPPTPLPTPALPPPAPAPVRSSPSPPAAAAAVHTAPASDLDDPPIDTLVEVGDMALGVRRDPRLLEIRDEAGLKQALLRVGQTLEAQRRQHPEEGSAELVERLAEYREELGRYMSGDVQIRGPGWTIETETGPALPQEAWWTPKP